MPITLLVIRPHRDLKLLFYWTIMPLIWRLPLGLQISKRSPWRERHRVLLQRRSCSFNHDLKVLFQFAQRAHINNWKGIQYSVVRVNSSSYFKVTPKVDINDQTLRASIIIVINNINILVVPWIRKLIHQS